MSPYRKPGHLDRRNAVIAEARRVRAELVKIPVFYNIGGVISSSEEIISALTGCLNELLLSIDDMPPEVPF